MPIPAQIDTSSTLRSVQTDPASLRHNEEEEEEEALDGLDPKNRSFISSQSTCLMRRLKERKLSGKLSRPVSAIMPSCSSHSEPSHRRVLDQLSTTGLPPTPQVHVNSFLELIIVLRGSIRMAWFYFNS